MTVLLLVPVLMIGLHFKSSQDKKEAIIAEFQSIPLAKETVDVVGPVPESERADYAREAQYNNNMSFYYTKSGGAVGYVSKGGFFFVEKGQTYGPFVGKREHSESEEQFWGRMESSGWKVGMRYESSYGPSDSKSGHQLQLKQVGVEQNCFDIRIPSQSSVVYDGKQVGLHSVPDSKCQAPVNGVLLSDDGLHYAYLVRAEHGYFVVVDGQRSSIYPMISGLHFGGSSLVFNALASDFANFVRVEISSR